ncbi:MAG: hypothetical protein D6722_11630 [Bacteroidetes bacterium]|nr:MAG: hypothetical protein D6722_11630 [Bacteroidota bacterium]
MALLLLTCKGEQPLPDLTIPDQYDGSTFAAHTADEQGLLDQLSTLTNLMKTGRTGATVSASDLRDAWNPGGTIILPNRTRAEYAEAIADPGGWLDQLAEASGGTYDPFDPNSPGGVYGGYLFAPGGIELEQRIEKGLFGAALFEHLRQLPLSEGDPAIADQALAIYGTSPLFPNSDNGSLHSIPDAFLAKYAARRDQNDGNGLYTQMQEALIYLQAALQAGPEYRNSWGVAWEQVLTLYERITAATILNYLHSSIAAFSSTNPDEATLAGGLHALSEAVGFLHGLRGLPRDCIGTCPGLSDQEIADLLTLMEAPIDGPARLDRFVQEPFTYVPQLQQALEDLQVAYQFSDQEVSDFRFNWVNEQGR